MREHVARSSEQALGLLAGEIEVDGSCFGGVCRGKRDVGWWQNPCIRAADA
jgi:hypothetical protein